MFITISITEDIKNHVEKLLDRFCSEDKTFSRGGNIQEANRMGLYGEVIFNQWLDTLNIKYESNLDEYLIGGCEFDIKINGRLIDIKTGHRKYPIEEIKDNFYFMIPLNQKLKDVYVNILINNEMTFGYIMGFIYGKDTLKYSTINSFDFPHRKIQLSNLTPMTEFIKGVGKQEMDSQ